MNQSYIFKEYKKKALKKLNEAISKGEVDEDIKDFLLELNDLENFFTTSSCSGRIILLGLDKDESKKTSRFLGKWHIPPVSFEEFWDVLEKADSYYVWLKQDSFIFHVVAKDIENAKKVLFFMRQEGIKHGGIIFIKEGKITIEFSGSQSMAVPLKVNGELLFSKEEVKKLLEISNEKLKKNKKQLERIKKRIFHYLR